MKETKDMKKVSMLFLVFIIVGLTANIGCKKGEKEFDITDGSWGFFLQVNSQTAGFVYKFVGTKQAGSVYFENNKVGTYTVSGDIVNLIVQHYDSQNKIYAYNYNGIVVDYFKMNGTFSITPPDGAIVNGVWTADR